MDDLAFVQALRATLHPQPYACELDIKGSPCAQVLLRRRSSFANDVVAVLTGVPADAAGAREQLESARVHAIEMLGEPRFSEIVVHVVIVGREKDWGPLRDALAPDRNGFRVAMIQAVHCVDPETGAVRLTVSQWGPVAYARQGRRLGDTLQRLLQTLVVF